MFLTWQFSLSDVSSYLSNLIFCVFLYFIMPSKYLNLRFTWQKPICIKKASQFFHGKICTSEIFHETNQNKTKFQTKHIKLTEKNITNNTFDKLKKTETQNEGCCSTHDPHPPRQWSCKRLHFPTLSPAAKSIRPWAPITLLLGIII